MRKLLDSPVVSLCFFWGKTIDVFFFRPPFFLAPFALAGNSDSSVASLSYRKKWWRKCSDLPLWPPAPTPSPSPPSLHSRAGSLSSTPHTHMSRVLTQRRGRKSARWNWHAVIVRALFFFMLSPAQQKCRRCSAEHAEYVTACSYNRAGVDVCEGRAYKWFVDVARDCPQRVRHVCMPRHWWCCCRIWFFFLFLMCIGIGISLYVYDHCPFCVRARIIVSLACVCNCADWGGGA